MDKNDEQHNKNKDETNEFCLLVNKEELQTNVKTKLNKSNGEIKNDFRLLDDISLNEPNRKSKTQVITNSRLKLEPLEPNDFSILDENNLKSHSDTEIINKNKPADPKADIEIQIINQLKKIFDKYEKAQYEAKTLEIFGKDDVSIEQLIDCYASDVQGFGDCGPLSILESRSDSENCRMRDWRFRNFLSDYVTKKLDISFSLSIDYVLKKVGYKKRETQENFLNELILDGDFKMFNKDKTDSFYSNQKVQELRKEILNAIDEISKLYTNVIQQNEEYKKQELINLPFRTELIEILNYFPLDGKSDFDSFVDKDGRDAAKQELLKSKININARILFMALSFIEKKPIFCLIDSEDEKGLFVFDASRIGDSKLKHKCIFRLDNNSVDNQIEYTPDLIYDFKKQLGNKDNPVFFFRSKQNGENKHHFQYLEPNNQEKRTAFKNDMNRLFFDKYIERLLVVNKDKQEIEQQKKLQDELKKKEFSLQKEKDNLAQSQKELKDRIQQINNKEAQIKQKEIELSNKADLLQQKESEWQALWRLEIPVFLKSQIVKIVWTSYLAYGFAWLFQRIFPGCKRYVKNFEFECELNRKINETITKATESENNFEDSIGKLMSYIENNIEEKQLENPLILYTFLSQYCSKHNTQEMIKKLAKLPQANTTPNLNFYIDCLKPQLSNKIEPDSENKIIKNKGGDFTNDKEKIIPESNGNKIIPKESDEANKQGYNKEYS